jgi:hypothetical protein
MPLGWNLRMMVMEGKGGGEVRGFMLQKDE